MNTFTLTIKLGNEAMSNSGDLAEALHKVANKLDGMSTFDEHKGKIRDTNGNTVGEWEIG